MTAVVVCVNERCRFFDVERLVSRKADEVCEGVFLPLPAYECECGYELKRLNYKRVKG